MSRSILFFAIAVIGFTGWYSIPASVDEREKYLANTIVQLKPIHEKIRKPKAGDWLDRHYEKGQSFRQYIYSDPVIPDRKRKILYIQPIGEFTDTQMKIVEYTAEYMRYYFSLDVQIEKTKNLVIIPPSAKRDHPFDRGEQVLTTYVLDKVLKPNLPEDAAAMIAFTSADLWPGKGWNFVFGQASIYGRVGVWSIYRNGDPEESEESFRICLKRTIKTAVHETGHMFSMLHCTAYECCMCGSNSQSESDSRPLYLCPECMPKVCWATKANPIERYQKLKDFCEKLEFKKEAEFFGKSIKRLK